MDPKFSIYFDNFHTHIRVSNWGACSIFLIIHPNQSSEFNRPIGESVLAGLLGGRYSAPKKTPYP